VTLSDGPETRQELTFLSLPAALVPICGTLSHVAMKGNSERTGGLKGKDPEDGTGLSIVV